MDVFSATVLTKSEENKEDHNKSLQHFFSTENVINILQYSTEISN